MTFPIQDFLHKAPRMRYNPAMKNNFRQSNLPVWKKPCLALIVFSLAAVFAACSGNSSPVAVTETSKNPLPDSAATGQPLYAIHCALCHGDDGKGEGMAGGSLGAALPALTADGIVSQPDGKLFLVIKNGVKKEGRPSMPPTKGLTDEQIWRIVAYVRSLKK